MFNTQNIPKKCPEEFIAWCEGYIDSSKVNDNLVVTINIEKFESQLNMLREWWIAEKRKINTSTIFTNSESESYSTNEPNFSGFSHLP